MNIFRKIVNYLFIFITILTMNFIIPRLMPGDPFTYASADEYGTSVLTEKQIDLYKEHYGLDKPILTQYVKYLKDTLRFNLGESIYYRVDVSELILNRIKWTLFIALVSLALSFAIGVILGGYSAYYRGSKIDSYLYFTMISISEIPPFLIGILLLFTISAKLEIFPLSGGETPFSGLTGISYIKDILYHGFLPTLALTISRIGGFYITSRNTMIGVFSKDYIRTARLKGLEKTRIIYRHGLKNGLLPIVTRLFLSLGGLIGSTVLVENVFNYPGIGTLMRDAIFRRDYILIQGCFLMSSLLVLVANLFVDLIYKRIDPRLKNEKNL